MSPRRSSASSDLLSCRQVAKVLQRHLDGEIDETTAARVAGHLEACRRCGLEASVYERLKASLARCAPAVDAEPLERLRRFGAELAAHGPDGVT